jgi:hypothetical protein
MPRMRSSAVCSALSSFRRDIGLRAGLLVAFGLKGSTSMSGEIPFAWIERPDGVK